MEVMPNQESIQSGKTDLGKKAEQLGVRCLRSVPSAKARFVRLTSISQVG